MQVYLRNATFSNEDVVYYNVKKIFVIKFNEIFLNKKIFFCNCKFYRKRKYANFFDSLKIVISIGKFIFFGL